jgi:hypothetical protein
MKNRLMAVLIAAITLTACGGGESATLSPSAQADDSCTTTLASPITTSKGSKDVRNELNEMFRQLGCSTSDLDSEVVKAESAREVERARLQTESENCFTRNRLTMEELAKISEVPCLDEVAAASENNRSASLNLRSDLEWTLHDAWLNSWRMLYNLAKIYPDSVQPKFLAYIIGWGEYVATCTTKRQWCQPDKK